MTAATVLLIDSSGQLLALPHAHVREVVRPGAVTRLPRAPFGCLGTINLRGDLVPVLALATLVGLARPPRGEALEQALVRGHLVVCALNESLFGLLVDRVLDLRDGELHPLEAGGSVLGPRSAELISGSLQVDARTAWLLVIEALVRPARRKLLERAVRRPGAPA